MHSTDLQFGVPYEFNAILDELVDGPHGMMADPHAEEEHKIAQMNLSLSQIETPTLKTEKSHGDELLEQRMMTEIEEQVELPTEPSPRSSQHSQQNPKTEEQDLIED